MISHLIQIMVFLNFTIKAFNSVDVFIFQIFSRSNEINLRSVLKSSTLRTMLRAKIEVETLFFPSFDSIYLIECATAPANSL